VLGCAPEEKASGRTWDLETDVVVVGTGTGLVGGLAAAVAGAKVVALEKRVIIGGSTGHSGGVAWIPNNDAMKSEGIQDSRENAMTYLTQLAQGQADQDLLDAFVDGGPEMLRFVEAHTPLKFRVSTIMGENADYHPEWPGAVKKGRSVEPISERQGLLGPELMEGLRTGFEEAGGEILLKTPAKRLILEDDESGKRRVIGVEAERDGAPFFIRARRGVHLAAGGFDWDMEMKRHFLRGPSNYSLGASGNEGVG
ncbi:MAG: FAD-binding protein, partial [bacterium]